VRSFTVTIPAVARGRRLKAARRESCRIIRAFRKQNQIDAVFIFARADFVNMDRGLHRRCDALRKSVSMTKSC
jgi:hypothetical protein